MYGHTPLRIGIIDSGINTHDEHLMQFVQKGIDVETGTTMPAAYHDQIGHGTACADLITRNFTPDEIRLFIYKTFDEEDNIEIEKLKQALHYVLEDEIDILNCSIGTIDPEAKYQLQEVVKLVIQSGIVVVCAWNDEDYTTYPANFDGVISVKSGSQKSQTEWGWERNKKDHFIFRGTKQRVKWKNNSQIFIGGSSFATVLCTRTLTEQLTRKRIPKEQTSIEAFLKSHATFEHEVDLNPSPIIPWNDFYHKMKKVGLYPFYKEMHGFVRFQKELPYEIGWISDFKLSKNSGKFTDQILKNCDESIFVHPGLPDDPQGIDTLILGYLDEAGAAQRKDLLGEALNYALKNQLNVVSFLPPQNEDEWKEKFNSADLWLRIPKITYNGALKILEGVPEKKAFDTPILGVFGTSAQQGKFTVQLALRYELQKRGYRIGQIGTEHQSGCFGMDYTFPSGYGAKNSIQIPLDFHIPILRRVVSEMDKGQYDIIIVGAQSGLMSPNPYYYGCIFSEHFFTATLPDKTILLHNQADPDEFVQRVHHYVWAKTNQPVFQALCFEDIIANDTEKIVSALVNRLIEA
jgi:uncharacterized NAD-dependent epimerase/dehydratase family protein